MSPVFNFAFVAGCICALFGCVVYYWILVTVSGAGFAVKLFATPRDMRALFRRYRELAENKGLPLWPMTAFWVSAIAAFGLGIFGYLLGSASR
jgi:hypothetical protein